MVEFWLRESIFYIFYFVSNFYLFKFKFSFFYSTFSTSPSFQDSEKKRLWPLHIYARFALYLTNWSFLFTRNSSKHLIRLCTIYDSPYFFDFDFPNLFPNFNIYSIFWISDIPTITIFRLFRFYHIFIYRVIFYEPPICIP